CRATRSSQRGGEGRTTEQKFVRVDLRNDEQDTNHTAVQRDRHNAGAKERERNRNSRGWTFATTSRTRITPLCNAIVTTRRRRSSARGFTGSGGRLFPFLIFHFSSGWLSSCDFPWCAHALPKKTGRKSRT